MAHEEAPTTGYDDEATRALAFGAVWLDHVVDRLGGGAVVATSYFRSNADSASAPRGYSYAITLDVSTGLLTISSDRGAVIVPRERILRLEPLPRAPLALRWLMPAEHSVLSTACSASRAPYG